MSILKVLKTRFAPEDHAEWEAFFGSYPNEVEEIPPDRLHPFSTTSIPQCGLRLPDATGRMIEHVRTC
eukprot:6202230-Pleurochrysis_carterae.AAC.1